MTVLPGAALFIPFLRPRPIITLLAAAFATSPAACFPRDFSDSMTFFPSNIDQLL